MASMTWHPEDKDQQVNQYLDTVNHAPYPTLVAMFIGLVCVATLVILVGGF